MVCITKTFCNRNFASLTLAALLESRMTKQTKVLNVLFRDDAFAGLESLEWLKIEDNSLTVLAGEGLFPKTLKVYS